MNSLFKTLFELFGLAYMNNFSEALNSEGLYGTIGIILFFITFIFLAIYYKVWDHPKYNQKFHWGISLLLSGLVSSLISIFYVVSKLNSLNTNFAFGRYFWFYIILCLWSMLVYFIFSFVFRYSSTNCYKTPY